MEEVILFNSREEMIKAFEKANPLLISYSSTQYYLKKTGTQFYLFQSKCPHSGYSLAQASINPYNELVCPWHGYRFDLSSGSESQQRCEKLFSKKPYWNSNHQLVIVL